MGSFFATIMHVQAESPTGWRGDGSGCYRDATPPLHWSASSNILWKTALPDQPCSSPILVHGKLYVCSEPATLTCLSADNGAILWRRSATYDDVLTPDEVTRMNQLAPKGYALRQKIGEIEQQLVMPERALKTKPQDEKLRRQVADLRRQLEDDRTKIRPYTRYLTPDFREKFKLSIPTPTSDGRNIFTLFGNGVAACFDQRGKMRWGRIINQNVHPNGQHASPLMVTDKMVVHMDRVVALNKRTGEPVWQVDTACKLGSPVRAQLGNTEIVLTAAGDILRAHDGAVLAQRTASLAYASPIVVDGIAYFIEHKGRALSLPTQASQPFDARKLWITFLANDQPFASPVFHNGLLYTCNAQGTLRVIDAGTGALLHSEKLPGGRNDRTLRNHLGWRVYFCE